MRWSGSKAQSQAAPHGNVTFSKARSHEPFVLPHLWELTTCGSECLFHACGTVISNICDSRRTGYAIRGNHCTHEHLPTEYAPNYLPTQCYTHPISLLSLHVPFKRRERLTARPVWRTALETSVCSAPSALSVPLPPSRELLRLHIAGGRETTVEQCHCRQHACHWQCDHAQDCEEGGLLVQGECQLEDASCDGKCCEPQVSSSCFGFSWRNKWPGAVPRKNRNKTTFVIW